GSENVPRFTEGSRVRPERQGDGPGHGKEQKRQRKAQPKARDGADGHARKDNPKPTPEENENASQAGTREALSVRGENGGSCRTPSDLLQGIFSRMWWIIENF